MKYKAIIFDFDGVLVESEPVHAKAWQILLKKRGYDLRLEEFEDGVGLPSPVFILHIEKKLNFKFVEDHKDIIHEKRTNYETLVLEELDPLPGVPDTLEALSGKIKMGICTASVIRSVGLIVKHFGWEKYFQSIITYDLVSKSKPDPALYLKSIEDINVSPEAILVFEDSPVGVQAARAANLEVVGVTSTYQADKLIEAGAFDTINNFKDPKLDNWFGAIPV